MSNQNQTSVDVCFLVASSAKKSYQKLSESYSAIEPPTWALLLAQSCRSVNFKVNIINTLNLIGLGIFFIILIVSIFLNKYHIVLLFFVLSYILGGIINHFYNGLASLKKKG